MKGEWGGGRGPAGERETPVSETVAAGGSGPADLGGLAAGAWPPRRQAGLRWPG